MNGYKTYISAAALFLFGAFEIINGDSSSGVQKIIYAAALVGIGHKLEKAAPKTGTLSFDPLQGFTTGGLVKPNGLKMRTDGDAGSV